MKLISHKEITALGISPEECLEWVKESFRIKAQAQIPAKISVHPMGYDYYTAMPCYLPEPYGVVGLKMIHRISGGCPAVGSDILLYRASDGELLSLLDGDWITAMRTGATAILSAQLLRNSPDRITYGFMGLGNTAAAAMLCLLECEKKQMHNVLLLDYKDQAARFMSRFSSFSNVNFSVTDNTEHFISESDVIISGITGADGLICCNTNLFREGCTLIPIHVRGFENCDTVFDMVVGDGTSQLKDWKNFGEFNNYCELGDVLAGKFRRNKGSDRILCYNYGLALLDTVFASKIYDRLKDRTADIKIEKETEKFWI